MKKQKTKKQGAFFKLLKKIFARKHRKTQIVGIENIPEEASIIVGNHAQIHGPILAEVKFPYKKYTWCIGNMLHLKEVPKYAFDDFWGYKPKWTHWFYRMLSYLIAPLCVYIFSNADTIGVYKDQRGISTFKNSVKALGSGAHLIIFPEEHEEYNHIVNEFQDKFVDVARLYYKETGKELSFVPMYNAVKLGQVVYGKPIKFDSSNPIAEERKRVCDYLKSQITELAESLPEHMVVPYANIPKRQYKKSRQ